MEEKEISFGKREILLIAGILAVILFFALSNCSRFHAPAAQVEVSIVDKDSKKQIIQTFSLSETVEYTIETADGGINELVIQDGEVWISDANCPNHDCVKKGKISQNGEMLVCIPHRLTVAVVGES